MTMRNDAEFIKAWTTPRTLNQLITMLAILEDGLSFCFEGSAVVEYSEFRGKLSRKEVDKIAGWLLEWTHIFEDIRLKKDRNSDKIIGLELLFSDEGKGRLHQFQTKAEEALKGLEQGNNSENTKCKPSFHFVDGIFYLDHYDGFLKFSENTMEYTILRVAFNEATGYRLDSATDGLEDYLIKQIYDAGVRLNEKINNKFGIDNFFELSFGEYIKRSTQ